MANEYEVPVWFRITAKNVDEAWWHVRQIMVEIENSDQLPPYVVEEPVPLLTGAQGWNTQLPPEEC